MENYRAVVVNNRNLKHNNKLQLYAKVLIQIVRICRKMYRAQQSLSSSREVTGI